MRISHQTRMVLQAFLDAPTEETYGYALSETTAIKPGSLYPILERLTTEGWIRARWEEVDEHAAARRRRRYYLLTAEGERNARTAVGNDSGALRALRPQWGES